MTWLTNLGMASSSRYSRSTSSGTWFPGPAKGKSDKVIGDDLRHERLSRRDADLRSGTGVQNCVGFARDLTAVGVADGQDLGLLSLRVTDGFQRVRRLTGLRDRDHEGAPVQNRVTVTEFARELAFHRNTRPVLDGVLGQHPRVVGGAARR